MAANPIDKVVVGAVEGFKAGFDTDFIPPPYYKTLALEYLSDQPGGGFTIDDTKALSLIYEEHFLAYETIVPVCGGASAVFRRLAEYSGFFYVMGIEKIIPSVVTNFAAVKHSDAAVKHCIGQWLSPEGMPKHQSVGLSDGYTEFVFCPVKSTSMDIINNNFPDELREAIHREAIEKEAEYER